MKSLYTILLSTLLLTQVNAQTSQSLTLQPLGNQGYEAMICFPYAGSPTANPASIVSAAWTGNSLQGGWRTLLKFDLSSIPATATLDSAFLSFYADNASTWGIRAYPTYGTLNTSHLHRITAPWSKTNVTWINQPAFSTSNSVLMAQSTGTSQDYLNINVGQLVKDQIQFGNHGFMFKMDQENVTYNSMIFHSSQSIHDGKQPKLVIYYRTEGDDPTTPTESIANLNPFGSNLAVFPNPASGTLNISLEGAKGNVSASIIDMTGRVVANEKASSNKISINVSALARGAYFVKVMNDNQQAVMPITLQ